VDRGGSLLLRSTAFGTITLGLKSLVLGYCSPGGNKPRAFSGRLRSQAARRLKETAKFIYEVSRSGGMRQGRPGYAISLRVRLIHARIRELILASGQWEADQWGDLPSNDRPGPGWHRHGSTAKAVLVVHDDRLAMAEHGHRAHRP